MCELHFFIAASLIQSGRCRPPELMLDLSQSSLKRQGMPGGRSSPPGCRLQASRRRSGCIPAEPYPPLERPENSLSASPNNGPQQKSGFARASGFENYKVSGFANYTRPVLLAPQQK